MSGPDLQSQKLRAFYIAQLKRWIPEKFHFMLNELLGER